MRKRTAILIALSSLLAGCGSDVEGSAVAGEPWDPCSITPETLERAGLDPDYREGWGKGVEVRDWALCSFKPPVKDTPYFVSVMSSAEHTVDETQRDSSNLDGRDLTIGDRNVFQYRTEVGRTGRSCHVAMALPPGVVVFAVDDMSEQTNTRLCELVVQYTEALENSLPEKK